MPAPPEIKLWADALDRLLQDAAAARQADDPARIDAVQARLRQFREDSPDYADALDRQASLAIFDLDLGITEQAVANIQARADEVHKLSKLIAGVAATANAQAKVLKGTLALQAIDAASSAITSFKKLRDGLDTNNPDLNAVAAAIDKTLASVQTLRTRLEKA